jgi:hypothetical protein
MELMEVSIQEQKENAVKWIEALLHGEHKQGKSKLGNKKIGFCCWGLGCYIVDLPYRSYEGWNDFFYKHVGFNSQYGIISPSFYNETSLARINDNTDAGFKRIGKYLIKHAKTNFNKEVAEHITNYFS